MSAIRRTDCFALWANQADGQCNAFTSRVFDDGGRITVGKRGVGLSTNETSGETRTFAPDQYFTIEFNVDNTERTQVIVNGEKTQDHGILEVPLQGAVGLFVKSGAVSIRRLIVSD